MFKIHLLTTYYEKSLISRKSIDYNLHLFVFNTSGTFFKDLCQQVSHREDTVFSVLC